MKINIKNFGYQKLLLSLILLLQVGSIGFSYAETQSEKQSQIDQNYLKNPYSHADAQKNGVSPEAQSIAENKKAIDALDKRIKKERDPNKKKELKKQRDKQQASLNKEMEDYQKKDPAAAKVAEQSLKLCVPAPGHYCVKIDSFQKGGEVISGRNGVELISNYVKVIYKVATGIIGVICVLIIVISGIQISFGGLAPEGVNQAKERIMQALLSLALLFGTALILKVVNPGFFVG